MKGAERIPGFEVHVLRRPKQGRRQLDQHQEVTITYCDGVDAAGFALLKRARRQARLVVSDALRDPRVLGISINVGCHKHGERTKEG